MSAQFIIGRAGAGKSAWCLDRTINACRSDPLGSGILWLVPRQSTFQIERDLCCTPRQSGFFRVRVMSFEELCHQVLAEVGGGAASAVTSRGRQIILGHLLRKHQGDLAYFRSVASHPGTAGEFASALDELERGGADLANLSSRLADPSNAALIDKTRDLQLIYSAYNDFLGLQRLDPLRRLQQATESFQHSRYLANATVYVDGFLHFTHRERRLLTVLAAVCPSIHITLTLDCDSSVLKNVHHQLDDLSLFHRMETEYRKLSFAFAQSAIKLDAPILLRASHRFKTPALAQIERWSGPTSSGDGVEFIEAPDKRTEVNAAARRIRGLAAGGVRYRDIAVSCRSLSDYQDLIRATFTEYSIPFFLDERRTAAHHPLIQFIRASLSIAAAPWPADDMLTFIKSGLCGLTPSQADDLENHLLLHGDHSGVWTAATANAASLIDPLAAFIQAINASHNARQFSTALFALLEKFPIRQTLSGWIAAAGPEQSAEHQQVWSELLELFQELIELLGDTPMTLAEFQAILDSALGTFDLAIAPATVDQVLIGPVDRTRPPAIHAAIILGLSDGQFPQPPPPPTILTDADRRSLANFADLEPNTQRRALDEEFLGYFAFTRASQTLIVTRSIADHSGRELAPSSLWRKLRSLAPESPLTAAPRPDDLAVANVATPRQLISGLMQWTRQSAPSDADPSWSVLYQWFTGLPRNGDAIDLLRSLAWPALSYANTAALSPDLAAQLFPSPLRTNARQLETFAACPFQHFARYGLDLSPRAIEGFTGGDLSRLCHEILTRRLDWRNLPLEELEARLTELAVEVAREFNGDRMLSIARNRHQLNRIKSTLAQTIATQRTSSAAGNFEPAVVSIRYGQGGKLPALKIGDHLLVSGEIDRADTMPDGRAAVIYDYRLTAGALSLHDVYHGLSLKLIAHLLAWQQANASRAAAALSLPILRPLRDDDDPESAPAPGGREFDLLAKPRGLIDENFILDLDTRLNPGESSDVISVRLNKDANPGYRDKTDVATTAEFTALLSHVRGKLSDLAHRIIGGDIAIKPYRIGTQTPCPNCAYRDVCRFVPEEGYLFLTPMKRLDVLETVVKEQA